MKTQGERRLQAVAFTDGGVCGAHLLVYVDAHPRVADAAGELAGVPHLCDHTMRGAGAEVVLEDDLLAARLVFALRGGVGAVAGGALDRDAEGAHARVDRQQRAAEAEQRR